MRSEQRQRAKEEERQSERWQQTVREDRKRHIVIHNQFELTHPSLPRILYITFILQCNKWFTQLVETTRLLTGELDSRSHTHPPTLKCIPAKLKQKQAFFNCYMGESDVSFSFKHAVLCIIVTLGHEFSALLMACMEKNKSIKHKLPVK